MTYAEKLRGSLIKFKTDELEYIDDNGEKHIQEAKEIYPICFPWFSSIVAGIAIHIIRDITGNVPGIDAMQGILFRSTLSLDSMAVIMRMDGFLNWLLDQEAPETEWESDDLKMWYDPRTIIDHYNTYIKKIQE